MLLLADRAEIFLSYVINTRQSVDGKYSCICRHADGDRLSMQETYGTQDEALKFCKAAAIRDSMHRSTAPQFLVKIIGDGIDKILVANAAAEALLCNKLMGYSYKWFLASDRQVLLENGLCRSDVRCIDLDGRSTCMEVSEQLIKLANAVLILATINPLSS